VSRRNGGRFGGPDLRRGPSLVAVLVLLVGIGSPLPAGEPEGQKQKLTWIAERNRLLATARAVLPDEDAETGVVAGPPGAPVEYDQELGVVPRMVVTYEPSDGSSGWTRKFWARDSNGKKWKVKYVSDETYTEVAATRIMWRMGYAADRVYPVNELVCRGCKNDDPWKSMSKSMDQPAPGSSILFRTVSIERSIQKLVPGGKKVQFFEGQGVDLTELDELIAELFRSDPERAAELDSLKALAFMLQDSDTKADNQRLVAMRLESEEPTTDEYNRVVVVFQDVGATFGRGKENITKIVSKLNYEGWAERMSAPWVEPQGLTLKLQRGLHADGGWKNPQISAAGLRFFLERSERLDRRDLVSIFTLARFPEASKVPAQRWAATWEDGIRNLRSRLP